MANDHDCTTHLMQHPEGGKRHLPQPRGPHSVGFVDLMTPGGPDKGSLLRIYYPTKEQCLEEHDRWPDWAEDNYVSGLLTFMKVKCNSLNVITVKVISCHPAVYCDQN